IVADPATRVRSLSLVSADEAHTQVEVWNRTQRAYPAAATAIELWQSQVALQPDALAIVSAVSDEACLTYRELDERAGAIARRLSAAGIGRGSNVALCLERSADMIAGILGALTAGAAYVPIDPSTPRLRVA